MPAAIPPQLPDDIAACHALIRELGDTVEQLSARMDYLLRRVFGTKSERIDPNQLPLFDGPAAPLPETSPEPEAEEAPRRKHKGHGRRALPEDLPRERVVHGVAPEDKVCPECGAEKCRIGEETSEQLDYVPASFHVIKHVCPKYACKACQEYVVQGKKPAEAIDKCLAGPGLIAHVITSKYADHLPLHRLEGIFGRHGVDLPRQTLCGWILQSADVLGRLVEAMKVRLLLSRVIHTDDTAVAVQVPGKNRKTHTGYLWVYVGDDGHPYTLYDFTWTRGREGPEHYRDYEDKTRCYRGYLQADAYAGYDRLYIDRDIVEAGCFAHARRKYFDARTSAAVPALEAVRRIKELYAIEAHAKKAGDDEHALRERRQKEAKPLLDEFHAWVLEQHAHALPKSPFGQACGYTLNHWDALKRYIDDGCLDIDNNAAERAIRPLCVGRNYAESWIMLNLLAFERCLTANLPFIMPLLLVWFVLVQQKGHRIIRGSEESPEANRWVCSAGQGCPAPEALRERSPS